MYSTRDQLPSFFDEVEKISAAQLRTSLLPHQQRVVDRIKEQSGLVVAHPLGSGKTLTSIAASIELAPDKTKVLVPAALQENYRKELEKHVSGNHGIEVGSLQKYVADGKMPNSDILIVDEAHRARNPGQKTYQILAGADNKKRLMLTASPMYNRASDIAAVVNLASGSKTLPTGSEFNKKFVAEPAKGLWALLPFFRKKPEIINKGQLKSVLNKWVDYEPPRSEGFPSVTRERVTLPMSDKQTKLHDAAWGRLGFISKLRLNAGLPPEKKDLSAINFFQSQARQVTGSLKNYGGDDEMPPKLRTATRDLTEDLGKNPRHKAVVYSNYLNNLQTYSDELAKRNVPHALFTGALSAKRRNQAVTDYNNGKLKALLVSSAGGEGLDLKGTRTVQVLEPHWNEEKLKQVIGRAVRYKSHEHLPKEEQTVHIKRYEAVPKGSKRGIEQTLFDMSSEKDALINQVKALM